MPLDLPGSFARVEKIAKASKARRMWYSPTKYWHAILYRKILSDFLGRSTIIKVNTFFERSMLIQFPAGTDIYLAGGKTDDAELRLTRFLLNELSAGDQLIDIGAHFGYYSLLASVCTKGGKVIAIEPSQKTYALLQMNTKEYPNIQAMHMAIAGSDGTTGFYEFPHIYSEYRIQVQKTEVPCATLDNLFPHPLDHRTFLKIDAEGSEYDILKGAANFLRQHNSAIIIMEYLAASRGNTNHKQALRLLAGNDYTCFCIGKNGTLVYCGDADKYLAENNMESDNLVFKKRGG
jgi:FkbM family methyltransferase